MVFWLIYPFKRIKCWASFTLCERNDSTQTAIEGVFSRDDEGNKDFLSSETDLSSSLDTIDALSMTVFGIKNGIALAVWWPAIRTSLFIWNANLIMMQSNI